MRVTVNRAILIATSSIVGDPIERITVQSIL
jgi:hypothetical protein